MIVRLRRLNDRDWDVLDRVLAAFLFVATALNMSFGNWKGPLAAELAIAAVVCAALVWRRKKPLLVAMLVVAGAATLLLGFTSSTHADPITLAVLIVAYSTGAHLELRRSLAGGLLVTGVIAAVVILKHESGAFFPIVFFGLVPWTVGRVIRSQTALARELTEKAEQEQIARDEEEARAAASERARVARELHDVLAHNLSVMVIQASAARRVADREPAAAVEAAELISRTGREALSELRYVFGPVRKEHGNDLGASPGLANLDQLASRAHRAGLPVELRVEGAPTKLSPGVDLAAYRVVQEALTNALKHARGSHAKVTVRYQPGDVLVEVVDEGAVAGVNGLGESGGHGLVGMRERVALYGGELEAGKADEGFVVRARLPVGGRST